MNKVIEGGHYNLENMSDSDFFLKENKDFLRHGTDKKTSNKKIF